MKRVLLVAHRRLNSTVTPFTFVDAGGYQALTEFTKSFYAS